jgi:hypothetical protein
VKGSATVGGLNGHRSNGSEIEGRPDPRLKTGVPAGARRSARRGLDGGARRGPDGVPDRAGRGGQTGWPPGPDRVPNGAGRGGQTGWPDGVPDGA